MSEAKVSEQDKKLYSIFHSLDINGDKTLDVSELQKAFAKSNASSQPSVAEIKALISTVTEGKSDTVDFDKFKVMMQMVESGSLPLSHDITNWLKTKAFEEIIAAQNKPVVHHKPIKIGGKGGGEANAEAPQGEKYKLVKKGPQQKIYKNLPEKKNLEDLINKK